MRSVVALAAALAATTAHANGRGPLTNGVYFRPDDVHAIYLRTTFGLLISPDDGCTFYWLCETNVGYGGSFDPKYGVATDGTIFATTFNGLRVSRDGGCSFATNASLPTGVWVDALDLGPSGEVWVGTATTGAANDVFASIDNGVTFESRNLPSSQVWYKSLRIARTDQQRVYVTGYQIAPSPIAHLYRTDNGGTSWTESPLAGVTLYTTPTLLVAAIDPASKDVAYVVSLGANPPAGDILYRTTDGGATLVEVLRTTGTIGDVVIADAQTVYVVTSMMMGSNMVGGQPYVSHDGGASFGALANAPQLACLNLRGDGALVGCGANWAPDFKAVAVSTDHAASWSKVWRFVELYGPMACPSGTAERDVCAEQWGGTSGLQASFGTTGPACGSNQAPPDGPPPPAKHNGCCDASGGAAGSLGWAGLVAVWLRRRRR